MSKRIRSEIGGVVAAVASALVLVLMSGCGDSRVDQLLVQLDAERIEEQRLALHELADLGSTAAPAIPKLIDLAAHAHPDVRRLSGLALSKISSELTSPEREQTQRQVDDVLTRQLDDKSLAVRNTAAFALLAADAHHEAAQRCLQKSMQRGEGGIIDRLTRTQPSPTWAVPTLIHLLRRDERPSIRRLSAVALGAIDPHNTEVQAALKQALTDRDDAVRSAAQRVLSGTGG